MAATPYERVSAILDGRPSTVPTPTTLHGTKTAIYSYEKRIAHKAPDGTWQVVERASSRTTNRHIDAVTGELWKRGETVHTVPYGPRDPRTGY